MTMGTPSKFSDPEKERKEVSMTGEAERRGLFYFWVGGYFVLHLGREREGTGACQLAEEAGGDLGWGDTAQRQEPMQ